MPLQGGIFDNSGQGALNVPGYSYPIDVELASDQRYAHGFDDWTQERLTAREVAMMNCMNKITDQSDWYTRIKHSDTSASLRNLVDSDPLIDDYTWQWCRAELRDMADDYVKHGYVRAFAGASCVIKSDTVILTGLPQTLGLTFDEWIARHAHLRGGSDQVQRHLSPHRFPLIYGRSPVLPQGVVAGDCNVQGLGFTLDNVTTFPAKNESRDFSTKGMTVNERGTHWSPPYQWLPFELSFAPRVDGPSPPATAHSTPFHSHSMSDLPDVRVHSYVNNLPQERPDGMRDILQLLLRHAIKPWNEVLVFKDRAQLPARIKTFGPMYEPALPPTWSWTMGNLTDMSTDEYKAARKLVDEYVDGRIPCAEIDTHGLVWAVHRVHRMTRRWHHPLAGISFTYQDWKRGMAGKPIVPPVGQNYNSDDASQMHDFYRVELQDDFRKNGLQVVAELRTITVNDADSPDYSHYHWLETLDGSYHDHIVATSIMYFDSDNVKPQSGAFHFRVQTHMDGHKYHHDMSTVDEMKIYGYKETREILERDTRELLNIQDIGTVVVPDGRLLTYPGVLRHRMERLETVDSSRPGRRRMVLLYLVDPHYRLCSTQNVPPQQRDWWEYLLDDDGQGLDGRVPLDIRTKLTWYANSHWIASEDATSLRDLRDNAIDKMNWPVSEMDEEHGWDFGSRWQSLRNATR